MSRILVVEDETHLAEGLRFNLEQEGYSVDVVGNGEEAELRTRLSAPATNLTQDLYIGNSLKTGRIMAKDEDVCLHCGLCAERCPTGAWDMQKFFLEMTHAGPGCHGVAPRKVA